MAIQSLGTSQTLNRDSPMVASIRIDLASALYQPSGSCASLEVIVQPGSAARTPCKIFSVRSAESHGWKLSAPKVCVKKNRTAAASHRAGTIVKWQHEALPLKT